MFVKKLVDVFGFLLFLIKRGLWRRNHVNNKFEASFCLHMDVNVTKMFISKLIKQFAAVCDIDSFIEVYYTNSDWQPL